MTINKMKARLGEIILERSFKYSENPPFTLASGKKSNYYFNCKPTTLDPEGMNLIGAIIFDMLKDTGITAAGGLTLGADPIANSLSVISYQKGNHGTKSAIEGNVHPGEKIAIIDDVITTGGSTITAIEQARKSGLSVEMVIALIDREEGGRDNILQHVDNIKTILTRTEIMELRAKRINETDIK
jgi:orotate phosphoribosyltransferase